MICFTPWICIDEYDYDGQHFSSVIEIYDSEKNIWTYETWLTRESSGHDNSLTVESNIRKSWIPIEY